MALSERALKILSRYKKTEDLIETTKKFVYEMLEPTPDRGDMLYRYEHSLRAAENGRMIAIAEKLSVADVVVACLLHDVGYRECGDDWHSHPQVSADIAREYLERIEYDPEMAKEIVQGIARHNLTEDLPEDMSVFQITIRDSDDIDRFDIIRTAMAMGSSVHEKTNVEIIESCTKQIEIAKWCMALPRGTQTAKDMMNKELNQRIELLEQIIDQAKKGFYEEKYV